MPLARTESGPWGLARPSPLEAKAFDGTVAVATLAGVAANVAGLDPIRALLIRSACSSVRVLREIPAR